MTTESRVFFRFVPGNSAVRCGQPEDRARLNEMNRTAKWIGEGRLPVRLITGLKLQISGRAFLSLIVPAFLLGAASLMAQAPGTGAIAGSVSDPSGAVISQASVTVVSEETQSSRTASTTTEGFFRVPMLPPGDYSLNVAASGFQSKTLRSIHVTVTETALVDIRLALGSASATTIEVNG